MPSQDLQPVPQAQRPSQANGLLSIEHEKKATMTLKESKAPGAAHVQSEALRTEENSVSGRSSLELICERCVRTFQHHAGKQVFWGCGACASKGRLFVICMACVRHGLRCNSEYHALRCYEFSGEGLGISRSPSLDKPAEVNSMEQDLHHTVMKDEPLLLGAKHARPPIKHTVREEFDFAKLFLPSKIPKPSKGWDAFGFSGFVCQNLEDMKIKTPTDVQLALLRENKNGKTNILATSEPSSGKRLGACLLAIRKAYQRLNKGEWIWSGKLSRTPAAIILCPGLGQAKHTFAALKSLANIGPIRTAMAAGTSSLEAQFKTLREGCDILVATPDRLVDFVSRKSCPIVRTELVIMDPASTLLADRYGEDVESLRQRGIFDDATSFVFVARYHTAMLQDRVVGFLGTEDTLNVSVIAPKVPSKPPLHKASRA
ncbi:P-loop containing nucleoside triphosphate hydrolase protein [Phyllosticta citribraziliensis]